MGPLDILILLGITVGPTKAAAMYLTLTAGADRALKQKIAIRTVATATITCGVFAMAGGSILRAFHISIPALLIAGGIILFVFALRLVLGEEYEGVPGPPKPEPSINLAVVRAASVSIVCRPLPRPGRGGQSAARRSRPDGGSAGGTAPRTRRHRRRRPAQRAGTAPPRRRDRGR
jgi:hypothetical protein